jgi:GDP-mannose 4,6 dehydratase
MASSVGMCKFMGRIINREALILQLFLNLSSYHSVREFVKEAFDYVGLDWQNHVQIDSRYIRPLEVDALLADVAKARVILGWEPKVTFRDLVRIMIDAEMEMLFLAPIGDGMRILKERFTAWHHGSPPTMKRLQTAETSLKTEA